jgi:hypothetical protein
MRHPKKITGLNGKGCTKMTDHFKKFKPIFKRLTDRFAPKLTPERIEDYYTEVKNHSISEIQLAVDEWIRDKNFMPTPAEFYNKTRGHSNKKPRKLDLCNPRDYLEYHGIKMVGSDSLNHE